ncbi:hypothetical protein AWZ03_005658 [Drosophila navojoa]|uniref:Uncharacterized protein n=1 Tax=Drosophila navojoa TaxID=7232 RepID=A0A484BGI0_DRONA|nr:uncharacterized protein LOC108653358 [Drosophila navojoa]TDG47877.1 hypothetical protein AWZ03_005658 [Drosophila navojoa]
MDQQLHRLTDRHYSEVEGLLQAMDMPSSDHEEIDSESCRLSRYNVANLYEGRQRCYTMPHVPPAPPSTPTLLTSNGNSVGNVNMNGTGNSNGSANGNGSSSSPTASLVADNQSINHFIYVKNGKNLRRETRSVDSELSKLFNVVSITNRLTAVKNRTHKLHQHQHQHLPLADRGILNASRTISKLHGTTKIFKIHRDPKEFLRETDEDSVSAPEYDEEEEDTRFRFFRRTRHSRRHSYTRMERKFARFEHHERMETIVDSFDAAMSFNDADT